MILESYSEFRRNEINEAFSEKDMAKAVGLIVKYLSSKVGNLYAMPEPEMVQHQGDSEWKLSQRYLIEGGKAVRFNWSKSWGNEIESIDIWDGSSSEPVIHIDCKGLSVAKILPGIVEMINNPNVNPTTWGDEKELELDYAPVPETLEESEELYEVLDAAEVKRRQAILKKLKTLKGAERKKLEREENLMRAKIREETKAAHANRITRNKLEKRQNTKVVESKISKFEESFSDPKTIYNDLNSLVTLVAKRIRPSLLVTGMAGIGKTYDVTKTLKEILGPSGTSWIHVKGKASPLGIYATLYYNRQNIVVFDDCDSVFKDSDAVNILKSALDSYDNRTISWMSPKVTYDPNMVDATEALELERKGILPNHFEFTGGCIFISNIPMSKMDQAVMGRSFTVDIHLKAEDVATRIRDIMPSMVKELSMSIKNEILNFIIVAINGKTLKKELSIRTFINACAIYQSGVKDWKRMVSTYA